MGADGGGGRQPLISESGLAGFAGPGDEADADARLRGAKRPDYFLAEKVDAEGGFVEARKVDNAGAVLGAIGSDLPRDGVGIADHFAVHAEIVGGSREIRRNQQSESEVAERAA